MTEILKGLVHPKNYNKYCNTFMSYYFSFGESFIKNNRYWFDWIDINPKLVIYSLLTTRLATIKISISLTVLFILLCGQR